MWVRRVINELYIKNENEEKVNKKEIEQIAKAKIWKFSRNSTTILVLLEKGSIKETNYGIKCGVWKSRKWEKYIFI